MTEHPDKLLFGVAEAATALALGKSTVWTLIANGRLETVRIGRRTLIKRASIEKLAEGQN